MSLPEAGKPKFQLRKRSTEPLALGANAIAPKSVEPNLSPRQKELLEQKKYNNRQNFLKAQKEQQEEEQRLKNAMNTRNFKKEEESWMSESFKAPTALQSNLFTNNSSIWSHQRLGEAIMSGDLKTVEEYVKHGFDMNQIITVGYPVVKKEFDKVKTYPLFIAFVANQTKIAKFLLSIGAVLPDIMIPEAKLYAKNTELKEIVNSLERNDKKYKAIFQEKFKNGNVVQFFKSLSPQEQSFVFTKTESLAHAGNVYAMAQLAYFYFYGVMVPKNLKTYYYWLKKAAAGGNISSMVLLALLLNPEYDEFAPSEVLEVRDTLGIPRNEQEAKRLINFAASQGNLTAKQIQRVIYSFVPLPNNNEGLTTLVSSQGNTNGENLGGGGKQKTRRRKRKSTRRKH